jgi:alcohol dehydrogenase class IV
MRFEFATAGHIVFGKGALREAGSIAGAFGSRALIVTGRSPVNGELLAQILRNQMIDCAFFVVASEPSIDLVKQGVRLAREDRRDMIIAIGGGSAIDAAKAIAGLAANPGELLDYLEVVGKGQPLPLPALPLIAIPTTAGTGTEVTRNAVLSSPEQGVKASLRSPLLLPRVALIDPELTYSLTPAVTAASGLDALTQLIEPFVSPRANPITDAFCREGIQRAARSLYRAWKTGSDEAAREDMALASLFGGLALANAGLGAVHGLASPLGGQFHAPHGAICAALLPAVMAMNVRALRESNPSHPALRRYEEIAMLLTANGAAAVEDGISWIRRLCAELEIPGLSRHGIESASLAGIADKASRASSMKANPAALSPAQLLELLQEAM